MQARSWAVVALVGLSAFGCSGGGGGGGKGGSSIAPVTSPGTGTPTSGTTTTTPGPIRGQDYEGTWTVSGNDPAQGSFSGTAVVTSTAQGFTVQRLVTYSKRAPDGREVLHAWNGTATKTPAGLEVTTTLRRADLYKEVGSLKRTAADMQPTVLKATLAGQGGKAPANIPVGTTLDGTFADAAGAKGPTETWTFSNAPAPSFPETSVKHLPMHQVDPTIRSASFAIYGPYHQLPEIAPYVNRPEFQAAQHFATADRTAKAWYRKRGYGSVVVLDKILDDISIAEELPRADAFSQKLFEKAAKADADVPNVHMRPCGMIAAVDTKTGAHWVSGDGALWQGCYAESQAFRYLVTKDPKALANFEKAVTALCICVEIVPNKTEFARAIDDVPASSPNFVQGTGSFANLAWLPGGNNDMLHGFDTAFFAANMILPAGHPLRARIGAAAKSLVDNVSIAQSGIHLIFQSHAAWTMTGDPVYKQKYDDALGLKNLHIQAWVTLGNGIVQAQGISDWSGHHLGTRTMIDLRMLGGANPNGSERGWRDAGTNGAKAAFANMTNSREGLLSVLAAIAGAPGASDTAKELLDEVPVPKPTGLKANIDLKITSEFCMSPYPGAPWKFDWMTNPGRSQAIEGNGAYFRRGTTECWWIGCPLEFGGWVDELRWVPQDYLHAYWLARYENLIGPSD